MKFHGVSVYTNNKYTFMRPRIYTNGAWKESNVYIYTDGTWKMVGGACQQLLSFTDSNGQPVYANGEPFLVPEVQGMVV